ncbi:hypothetical protein [Streptomyces sp. NBC_00829]|uniref:hypothetical protein n=1 Tax=Streptomyces sp. NBC_00829 TaxID=2903679 RepID=UPI00386718A9|nr:hypothetical protein OG293_40980 [Streptomyces sp. NBC_00829]
MYFSLKFRLPVLVRVHAERGIETVIEADSTLTDTVDRIMLDTGLAGLPALRALSSRPAVAVSVP